MIGAYKEEKGVVIMDNQYNYYEPDPSDPVNGSDSVRPDGDAPQNKSGKPKKKLPIEDFLRAQGRFKHLFKSGNEHLIEEFQKEVDRRWNDLLYKCNR